MSYVSRGILVAALLLSTLPAFAVKLGELAPSFIATTSTGKKISLSDFKGHYVVLEWHNNGCPYTKKHYTSGNMQALQKLWTGKGVIWFTVISSAPGKQGYVTAGEENAYLESSHAVPTAALLDPDGTIAHLYEAKTTPQMIIISPEGKLIYDGAIDDHPTSDPADIPASKNYVSEALTAAMAGKPVPNPLTRPYGCSIKYAD